MWQIGAKKRILIYLCVFFTIVFSAFISPLAHLMFSNRLGIFFSSVASVAIEKLNLETFHGSKKELLLTYLVNVTNDLDPNDSWVQWKFVSGGGACNHLADMYILLMEYPLNLSAGTFGLIWKDGISRHTVSMVRTKSKNWAVYDSLYNKVPKDDNGEVLTTSDFCSLDLKAFERLPLKTKEYFWSTYRLNEEQIWSQEGGLQMFCERLVLRSNNAPYSERPKWSQLSISTFNLVPKLIQKSFFKSLVFLEWGRRRFFRLINKEQETLPFDIYHGDLTTQEFWLFMNARLDHIFLDYDSARKSYKSLINLAQKKSLLDFSKQYLRKLDYINKYLMNTKN